VFSLRSPCLYSIIKYRVGSTTLLYARRLYLLPLGGRCLRVANF
jgi:hypothetical protein